MSNIFLYIVIILTATRLVYQWDAHPLKRKEAIRKGLWEFLLLVPIMNIPSGIFLLVLILTINTVSVWWENRVKGGVMAEKGPAMLELSRFWVYAGILIMLILFEPLLLGDNPLVFSQFPEVWESIEVGKSWKIFSKEFLGIIAGMLILTNEVNHLIRYYLSKLKVKPRKDNNSGDANEDFPFSGFTKGRVIGVLERAMIFMVVLANQLGAIGFILTAKGVARLKDLEDKDFVEYLIIGTFMSALFALLVGLIFQSILFPERFLSP